MFYISHTRATTNFLKEHTWTKEGSNNPPHPNTMKCWQFTYKVLCTIGPVVHKYLYHKNI